MSPNYAFIPVLGCIENVHLIVLALSQETTLNPLLFREKYRKK
jgi:hypothetical protein